MSRAAAICKPACPAPTQRLAGCSHTVSVALPQTGLAAICSSGPRREREAGSHPLRQQDGPGRAADLSVSCPFMDSGTFSFARMDIGTSCCRFGFVHVFCQHEKTKVTKINRKTKHKTHDMHAMQKSATLPSLRCERVPGSRSRLAFPARVPGSRARSVQGTPCSDRQERTLTLSASRRCERG